MNTKIITSLILTITLLSTISGCTQQKETSNNNHHTIPINENSTIYVGSTHADYKTIQEAIDAAVNGTKIIIENGSYNELIYINKTVTLMGEDKNTTIINFNPNYKISQIPLITIKANDCLIENLQITLSNISVIATGISVNSKNTTIQNNIITKVTNGVDLTPYSELTTIKHNEIYNNLIGIMTTGSVYNIISHNFFSNNTQYNIYLSGESDNNNVSFNILNKSDYGIRIKGSRDNRVYKNCIENNQLGIYCCCGAMDNHFYNNTLFNNSVKNARENAGLYNIWYDYPTGNGNYWDDYTGKDENHDGRGDTPYAIGDAEGQDMNPLMHPPSDAPCSK
jgi:parallel beta-helix repeat protein